jgi:hypothetical protein
MLLKGCLAVAVFCALVSLPRLALAAKAAPRGITGDPIVKNVRLQDIPGCGNSEFLIGGVGATCVYQTTLGPNEA